MASKTTEEGIVWDLRDTDTASPYFKLQTLYFSPSVKNLWNSQIGRRMKLSTLLDFVGCIL